MLVHLRMAGLAAGDRLLGQVEQILGEGGEICFTLDRLTESLYEQSVHGGREGELGRGNGRSLCDRVSERGQPLSHRIWPRAEARATWSDAGVGNLGGQRIPSAASCRALGPRVARAGDGGTHLRGALCAPSGRIRSGLGLEDEGEELTRAETEERTPGMQVGEEGSAKLHAAAPIPLTLPFPCSSLARFLRTLHTRLPRQTRPQLIQYTFGHPRLYPFTFAVETLELYRQKYQCAFTRSCSTSYIIYRTNQIVFVVI